MANLKTCVKNILEDNTVSVVGATEDSNYPLYRVYDRDIGKFFKTTTAVTMWIKIAVLNLLTNPGFETGNFTGWTQNSATIDNVEKKTGSYSAKLVAAGANITGARSSSIDVDTTKKYRIIVWNNVSAYTSGNYTVWIRCYDVNGTFIADVGPVISYTATADWTMTSKSIGPGADIAFSSDTAKIGIFQYWSGGTPTGTANMDDVFFNEDNFAADRLLIPAGHNLAGITLNLTCADDPVSTTQVVPQWVQPDNKLINKSWTSLTKPWWYLKITSPASIPQIAEMFLTQSYEWERNPARPTGSLDPEFNRERDLSAVGSVRYLIHGDKKERRSYHMPRCIGAQKANILDMYNVWAGAKPFWLCDHEGIWIYGELVSPLNLKEESYDKFSFDFDFLEVLP